MLLGQRVYSECTRHGRMEYKGKAILPKPCVFFWVGSCTMRWFYCCVFYFALLRDVNEISHWIKIFRTSEDELLHHRINAVKLNTMTHAVRISNDGCSVRKQDRKRLEVCSTVNAIFRFIYFFYWKTMQICQRQSEVASFAPDVVKDKRIVDISALRKWHLPMSASFFRKVKISIYDCTEPFWVQVEWCSKHVS